VAVDLKHAVELALARRPEIVQASIGIEVSGLEICAQNSRRLWPTVWTFAAGSDIHANPLPGPSFSPGYRPGAIGMEMPVTITGKRGARVEQAEIYNSRAHSVLEKTTKLIRLETEQAYLRYVESSEKLAEFRKGAKEARAALDILAEEPPITRNALTNRISTATLLTDLRLEMNRARYEMLVALIALERATVGGLCAGLDKAPVAIDFTREEPKK
jgi:outer membrane protein TolC